MCNTGTLYAIDKDAKRLNTLKRLADRNGMTNVTAVCNSFLAIDPHTLPYSDATHILCDPSCSGSGILDRHEHLLEWAKSTPNFEIKSEIPEINSEIKGEGDSEAERLKKLSLFQLSVILHAFKFPKVQKIVYSTCSVHQIENEDVVQKALHTAGGLFKLSHILPSWHRRGYKQDFTEALHCIRALPMDNTIGFFCCIF